MREFLLLGHILFAIIWIGSQITTQVLAVRVRKSPERTLEFLKDIDWLGNRLQGPSAVLTLIFGILLVIVVEWPFALWTALGLIGWVAVMAVAGGYLVPQTRKLIALAGQHGIEAPDVQAKLKTVLNVTKVATVLLILIVLDMIAKPGM
jgi:hypothetical protein